MDPIKIRWCRPGFTSNVFLESLNLTVVSDTGMYLDPRAALEWMRIYADACLRELENVTRQ